MVSKNILLEDLNRFQGPPTSPLVQTWIKTHRCLFCMKDLSMNHLLEYINQDIKSHFSLKMIEKGHLNDYPFLDIVRLWNSKIFLKTHATYSFGTILASVKTENYLGPVFRPFTNWGQYSFQILICQVIFRHYSNVSIECSIYFQDFDS